MKRKIMLIDPYFNDGLKGFPLGLAYIAGALKKEGYDVCAVDLTARSYISKKSPKQILAAELSRFKPDIVGITSTSPSHLSALKAARQVKRYANIPVIKGGPHETNCAETTIKNNPEIDYSVIGEGEKTVVELVDAILNKRDISGIKGVVYRKGNNVLNNGRRPLMEMDSLPRPARELFYLNNDFDNFYSASLFNGKKSTTIMTSRGCPHACSFCSSKSNWGRLRKRTVDNVIKEIEELNALGFSGFSIEDDYSIADKKWFLEFAEKIVQKGLDIEYSAQTRVNAIDDNVAAALRDTGCRLIYFGIESGVQEILDNCKKGITVEQAKNAFETVRKYGVRSMASIQFGLPGEDFENLSTVRETIRVINDELKPDEFAVSYTCLYPGSPLAVQEGVTPQMYESFVKAPVDNEIYAKTAHGVCSVHPKGLTPEKIMEIERLLQKESKVKRFEVTTFYNV